MIIIIFRRAGSERLGWTKCALAVCANATARMEVDAAALRAFVYACARTAHTKAHRMDEIAGDETAVLDARSDIRFESTSVAALALRDSFEIAPEEAGHRWTSDRGIWRILDTPALAEEAKGAVCCLAN